MNSKSKFFAKIAHEFKTPLTIIIGLINKLRDENQQLSEYSSVGKSKEKVFVEIHLLNRMTPKKL